MCLNGYSYCQLNDSLNVIFVELAKFKNREVKRLFDLREEWCYILKESSSIKERKLEELSQKGAEVKTAVENFIFQKNISLMTSFLQTISAKIFNTLTIENTSS